MIPRSEDIGTTPAAGRAHSMASCTRRLGHLQDRYGTRPRARCRPDRHLGSTYKRRGGGPHKSMQRRGRVGWGGTSRCQNNSDRLRIVHPRQIQYCDQIFFAVSSPRKRKSTRIISWKPSDGEGSLKRRWKSPKAMPGSEARDSGFCCIAHAHTRGWGWSVFVP